MKQKLSLIALILAALLLFTACGSQGGVSGKITGTDASPAPESAEPETEFKMGDVVGGAYENAYFGIGCTLDDSWTYYGDDMIAELNGLVTESISDEEILAALEEGRTFYDMYAASDTQFSTINVVIENAGLALINEEAFVEQAVGDTKKVLEASGMANVSIETTKLTFAGKERFALSIYAEMQDMAIYQKGIVMKKGRYLAFVTLASFNEDKTGELLELFYPVGE